MLVGIACEFRHLESDQVSYAFSASMSRQPHKVRSCCSKEDLFDAFEAEAVYAYRNEAVSRLVAFAGIGFQIFSAVRSMEWGLLVHHVTK